MAGKKTEKTLGPLYEPTDEEWRKAGLQAAKFCKDKEDLEELLRAIGVIKQPEKPRATTQVVRSKDYTQRNNKKKQLRHRFWMGRKPLTPQEIVFAFPKGIPNEMPDYIMKIMHKEYKK